MDIGNMLSEDGGHFSALLRSIRPRRIIRRAKAIERPKESQPSLFTDNFKGSRVVSEIIGNGMFKIKPPDPIEEFSLYSRRRKRCGIAGVCRPVFRTNGKKCADIRQDQKHNGHKNHHEVKRDLSTSDLQFPVSR